MKPTLAHGAQIAMPKQSAEPGFSITLYVCAL